VLVVPSTWEENAPLVIGEAQAAGLRLVLSDLGGLRELAPAATFVEPDSVEALRNALVAEVRRGRGRLLSASPGTMSEHARTILSHYAALRSPNPICG